MQTTATTLPNTTVERALASKGASDDPIYKMVRRALVKLVPTGAGRVLDVGCGTGSLHAYVKDIVESYAGADVVRYDGFPSSCEFHHANLDTQRIDLADSSADIVLCLETIEHLENPRALVRELARLVKPGGWIVVTTPNNLSFLSKLTLVLKNQFNAFQAPCYPAHITALLEIDLVRIMTEAGLTDIRIRYSNRGRIPGVSFHWPSWLLRGRLFSDNVLAAARKKS